MNNAIKTKGLRFEFWEWKKYVYALRDSIKSSESVKFSDKN